LKKLMIVALAAIATVALAAVAIAQTTDRTHTSSQKITPTQAGTPKKPVNGKIDMTLRTPENEDSTVDAFTFYFPSQVRVSTAGFKYCTVNDIEKNGNVPPAKCDKARAGSGSARAYLNKRGEAPQELEIQIFTGSKTTLTIYVVDLTNPGIKAAFVARIEDANRAGFKQRLRSVIPDSLQNPAGVTFVVLEEVRLIIGRKPVTRRVSGRRKTFRLVALRGCAANRQHTLGSELVYTKPDGAPNTFVRGTTPCKKA